MARRVDLRRELSGLDSGIPRKTGPFSPEVGLGRPTPASARAGNSNAASGRAGLSGRDAWPTADPKLQTSQECPDASGYGTSHLSSPLSERRRVMSSNSTPPSGVGTSLGVVSPPKMAFSPLIVSERRDAQPSESNGKRKGSSPSPRAVLAPLTSKRSPLYYMMLI